MKIFEYMKPSIINSLDPTRRKFVAKMIKKEVEQVAMENGISEEQAYFYMSKGLYGGDREIDSFS